MTRQLNSSFHHQSSRPHSHTCHHLSSLPDCSRCCPRYIQVLPVNKPDLSHSALLHWFLASSFKHPTTTPAESPSHPHWCSANLLHQNMLKVPGLSMFAAAKVAFFVYVYSCMYPIKVTVFTSLCLLYPNPNCKEKMILKTLGHREAACHLQGSIN